MRTFKFRVWYYHQKKFDYGDLQMFTKCSFPLHWCAVQQFTGLKDSKGVDIYEGDIVDYPYLGNFIVEYVNDTEGSHFILSRSNNNDAGYTLPINNNYTVVGHIFDNMLGAKLRLTKRLAGREMPNLDEVEFGTPHLKED